MRQVHDGVADLGAGQHLLKRAATRNDQHDAGDGFQAFSQAVAKFFRVAAAHEHQRHGGEQHAQQHGDQRVAQEGRHVHQAGILGQQHLGQRVYQHQQGGQQGRQDTQADAGCRRARTVFRGGGELLQQGLVGAGGHARREERAVQRATQHHGGQGGKKAVDHRGADGGLQGGDGGQRAGMRRHHAVHGGQGGNDRHAHVDVGRPFEALLAFQLARHAEDQRQHDHQAHFEEHGDADDERHQRHGPRNHADRRAPQDGVGQALGGAGICEDLAQHGAKRDNHADRAQRFTSAVGQVLHDGRGRHARGEADADRDDQ
ncbi:hypothetical protein D3C85_614020 [compost metagenome]